MKARSLMLASLIGLLVSGPATAGTTYLLQPGPGLNDGTDDGSATKGKDTSAYPWPEVWEVDLADYREMWLFNSPCNISGGKINPNPGFLQFSLEGMPQEGIVSATIDVYARVYFNGAGWPWPTGNYTVSMRRITDEWVETGITTYIQPGYDTEVLGSHVIPVAGGKYPPTVEWEGWLSFDVTALYQGWADGSIANQGVAFVLDTSFCQNGDFFSLLSSDNEVESLRPTLKVVAEDSAADSDGDGIPDESDDCPASDLEPYVTIGDCHTGVTNSRLESGCSFNDEILKCQANAVTHGDFLSCVTHLTNLWDASGHIAGKQKGSIVRCAARN